jgi:hypothetical protein
MPDRDGVCVDSCVGQHDGAWRRPRLAGRAVAAAALLAASVGGCGSNAISARTVQPAAVSRGHVLAHASEKVLGGAIAVAAVTDPLDDGHYLVLRSSLEEGTPARVQESSATGTPLAPRYALVSIGVNHVCVAGRRYRLAWGLLGMPSANVFADGAGPPTRLFKLPIPLPKGDGQASLVYRLLKPGQTTIVTRTPSGRVVKREAFSDADAAGECR